MRRRTKEGVSLVILLLAGLILGNLLGEILGSRFPVLAPLAESRGIALGPCSLDLMVISLTLGLGLQVNLVGVVGALVGIILWWRR
ncbi:MAG: DUF4321 domain-containing protein [Bacillota bacterium]|nr:DUF4321 domain-containing protein [Bacillota bacterium]MDI7250210.1 DUF4321 domain-containing protein [Bacillota bacterium]